MIYYTEKMQLEKFLLITIWGILEQLSKGIIKLEDAEKIIFNVGVADNLQKQKINGKIIKLILRGSELEDIYEETYKEKIINDIKLEVEDFLKIYSEVPFDRPILVDFHKRVYKDQNINDFWNRITKIKKSLNDDSYDEFNHYINSLSYFELVEFNNRLSLYLDKLNDFEECDLFLDEEFEYQSLCKRMEIIFMGHDYYKNTISLGKFSIANYKREYLKYIEIINDVIIKKQHDYIILHNARELI